MPWLLYTCCTYPILNILLFFYSYTHDLGISLILFTCLEGLIFAWPVIRTKKLTHRIHDLSQPGTSTLINALKYLSAKSNVKSSSSELDALGEKVIIPPLLPEVHHLTKQVHALHFALYILGTYLFVGLWSALLLLKDMSLSALNDTLYPFVPHFVTYPDLNLKWFTFLQPGWFFSLVQPLFFFPSWLIIVLLLALFLIGGYKIFTQSLTKTDCLLLIGGAAIVIVLATWGLPPGGMFLSLVLLEPAIYLIALPFALVAHFLQPSFQTIASQKTVSSTTDRAKEQQRKKRQRKKQR